MQCTVKKIDLKVHKIVLKDQIRIQWKSFPQKCLRTYLHGAFHKWRQHIFQDFWPPPPCQYYLLYFRNFRNIYLKLKLCTMINNIVLPQASKNFPNISRYFCRILWNLELTYSIYKYIWAFYIIRFGFQKYFHPQITMNPSKILGT